MNYSEFKQGYDQASRRSNTQGCVTVAVLVVIVGCLGLGNLSDFYLSGFNVIVLTLACLFFFVTASITNSVRNRRFKRLSCQSCQHGFDQVGASRVAETNQCPHCGQAAYPVDQVCWFEQIAACEIDTRQRAVASDDAEGDNPNPYAPPMASISAQPQGCNPLVLLRMWFAAHFNSIRCLLTSEAAIIERANRDLAAQDLKPLREEFQQPHARSQRRLSVLWLACVLLSFVGAAVVCTPLVINGDLASLGLAIGLMVTFFSLGSLLFGFTVGLAPRRWQRWFHGSAPPMRPLIDEDTGVYGIVVHVLGGSGGSLERPLFQMRYRLATAGEFTLGLLDRDERREFRTRIVCPAANVWQDVQVNFSVLLSDKETDFAGDRIRILPAPEVGFELDNLLQVRFPSRLDGRKLKGRRT